MTQDDEASRDLLDAALRDEIELVSDLVVAASTSTRHFTPDEVDALLGIPSATHDAHDEGADNAADCAGSSEPATDGVDPNAPTTPEG